MTKKPKKKHAVEVEGVEATPGSLVTMQPGDLQPLAADGLPVEEPAGKVQEQPPQELQSGPCAHARLVVDRSAATLTCADCERLLYPSEVTVLIDGVQSTDPENPVLERDERVKPHLRCPRCWDEYGGRAIPDEGWKRRVSTPVMHRRHTCSECGIRWVVEQRTTVDENGVTVVTNKVLKIHV